MTLDTAPSWKAHSRRNARRDYKEQKEWTHEQFTSVYEWVLICGDLSFQNTDVVISLKIYFY